MADAYRVDLVSMPGRWRAAVCRGSEVLAVIQRVDALDAVRAAWAWALAHKAGH